MKIPALLLSCGLTFALAVPAFATPADDGAATAMLGLRSTLSRLARNAALGRDNGTPASTSAQKYLIRRLRRLGGGINPGASGDEAFLQHFTFGNPPQQATNVLAVIPGTDLANEYVMIGAHYDHLDTRSDASGHCRANGAPGGAVCNGATDNAAGTAAVLAVGRALRRMTPPPRRSIVLALWDAEEDGLQGSLYYVNHPLVPLGHTVGYVNFDVLGATLLPTVRDVSFAVGAETGGTALQDLVTASVAAQSIDVRPVSYIFGQLRSDYANLVNHNVPTVFFSDSTGGCYHTTGDDISVVSFPKLRQQSAVGFRVAEAMASGAVTPVFVTPNNPLASYGDAESVAHLLDLAIPTDLALLQTADQTAAVAAKAQVDQMVADGPAAFDSADIGALLGVASNMITALTRVPCQAF